MRIIECENPVHVLSPYTGEIVRCRCNTCNSCRNSRAKTWVDRLEQESQCHKYCYMIFLSYDDAHLPALFFSDDMDYVELNRPNGFRVPLSDLIDYCHDEYGEFLEDDLAYLRSRLIHPLGLPVCYSKDVSDFLKRFNKYCFKNVTHKYENFRYFICHEYGPTTYRCHCHGLFYFDNPEIARRFQEILSATWQNGDSNSSAILSAAGRSYVAQYVNMSSHLPSFYAHPKIRQRHQFSKCPSIGTDFVLDKEISGIYDSLPVERLVWKSQSNKYVNVPLNSSFKTRFFPKLQGYRNFLVSDRVKFYGITQVVPAETFEDFRRSINLIGWLNDRRIANDDEKLVGEYLDYLHFNIKPDSSVDTFTNSLKHWYSISKRLVRFSNIARLPLSYIAKQIDEYWKKVDYLNLTKMYKFQEEYVRMYPLADLVYMYPEFSRNLDYYQNSFAQTPMVRYALQSFGLSSLDSPPNYQNVKDFLAMKQLSEKIYKDTHKRMSVNAYRESQLSWRDPKLYSIISNYQKFH